MDKKLKIYNSPQLVMFGDITVERGFSLSNMESIEEGSYRVVKIKMKIYEEIFVFGSGYIAAGIGL